MKASSTMLCCRSRNIVDGEVEREREVEGEKEGGWRGSIRWVALNKNNMISTHKSKCLKTKVLKKIRNKCPPLHQVQHKIPSLYTQLSPPKLVVLLFVFIFEMFISFENLALCLLVVVVLLDTSKACNYRKDEHFSIQNVKFTTEPRCDFQSGDVKKQKLFFAWFQF